MKKYFFDLRTMAVVAGLTFLLMHGEVVFGQEADNTDSKSGAALKLRDQNLLTTEEKKKRFERRKGKVLENIEKRRALLNSANSREDLKSCRNRNKKGLEAFRAQRKEMRGKMREKRERRGKEMN